MAEPLLENSSLTVANFSFDVYKWAVACVSTRINFVPSSLALNPDTKPLQVRFTQKYSPDVCLILEYSLWYWFFYFQYLFRFL